MHIITRKRLNDFAEVHPEAKSPLQHWHRLMKKGTFSSFAELPVASGPTVLASRQLRDEFTAYRIKREAQRLYSTSPAPEGHQLANVA